MLLIFITLFGKISSLSYHFILAPLDHHYCANRSKNMIMFRLPMDYGKLSMRIEPNMSSFNFISPNSLCPLTVIESPKKSVKLINSTNDIGYWYSILKVSGELSSCRNYIGIGQLSKTFTESDIIYMEKNVHSLNCQTKLPVTIPGLHTKLAIYWKWSKETLPSVHIEIISYIQFATDISVEQRIKACSQEMGFWCGEMCIDGRLRCDGMNDCAIFTTSQLQSADENNCEYYRNNSRNAMITILCLVGLILIISACKICVTNFVMSKRLQKKKQTPEINSSLYSLSAGESEDESAYEDMQNCSETDSKKNSSLLISGDEETQEELLETSKEYLNTLSHSSAFQPHLIASKKQNEISRNNKSLATVELHSLSSYQLRGRQSPALTSTNISLTSAFLSQGQEAILEMNSPGSSRTFRKIFNKNLNKTTSYDRIKNHQDMSTNSSPLRGGSHQTKSNTDEKPKSHTISRLENNRLKKDNGDDYEGFTSYVIV